MKYGINSIGPKFFDGAAPDLAVAGPNVRLQSIDSSFLGVLMAMN